LVKRDKALDAAQALVARVSAPSPTAITGSDTSSPRDNAARKAATVGVKVKKDAPTPVDIR